MTCTRHFHFKHTFLYLFCSKAIYSKNISAKEHILANHICSQHILRKMSSTSVLLEHLYKGPDINNGEGATKFAGSKLFAQPSPPPAPHSHDRVKPFMPPPPPPPPLKEWKLLAPPFSMDKTSSTHVKTVPKLL